MAYNDNLPTTTLYWHELISELDSLDVDVDAIISEMSGVPGASVLRYPDGTLQIEGSRFVKEFEARGGGRYRDHAEWLATMEGRLQPQTYYCGSTFNSLPALPEMQYVIVFWGELIRQWETGVQIQAGRVQPPRQVEPSPIDKLLVTVAFHKRLPKRTREAFVACVSNWLASVAHAGVFGEGRVAPVSSGVTFYERIAQFSVDASRSGQNTINWLILSLIGFYTVHAPEGIYFTTHPMPDISFDEQYRLFNQDPIELPFLISSVTPCEKPRRKVGAVDKAAFTLVCGDEGVAARSDGSPDNESAHGGQDQPFGERTSDWFAIVTAEGCAPENCRVSVSFGRELIVEERDSFSQVILCWLSVGQYGGFGGHGFHHYDDVIFLEAGSASFWCDMGPADSRVALNVLINVLETWHRDVAPIDKVIFGKVV